MLTNITKKAFCMHLADYCSSLVVIIYQKWNDRESVLMSLANLLLLCQIMFMGAVGLQSVMDV